MFLFLNAYLSSDNRNPKYLRLIYEPLHVFLEIGAPHGGHVEPLSLSLPLRQLRFHNLPSGRA